MKIIEKYIKRYGPWKVSIGLILFVMIVMIINVIFVDKILKEFTIEDKKFTFVDLKDNKWIFKDDEDHEVIASTPYGDESLSRLKDIYIEYKNQNIKRTVDIEKNVYEIYINEKSIYKTDFFNVSSQSSNGEIKKENTIFEVYLIREIIDISDYILNVGPFQLIIFGLILAIIGVLQTIFPEFFWNLKYASVVYGGEPSDFYLFIAKKSGIVIIILGLISPYYLLYLY